MKRTLSDMTLRFMPGDALFLSGTTDYKTQIDCVTDQFHENTLLIPNSLFIKLR